MSSYREELCNKDERGQSMFSPLCNPGRTVDSSVKMKKQVYSTYGDLNCNVPKVDYPKLHNPFDDGKSATDFFKDPTFAQRNTLRLRGKNPDEVIPNPSLKLYQTQKLMERTAANLLRSL